MKIFLEILHETMGYVLALFYIPLGIFFRLPDMTEGEKNPVILIPGILGSSLMFGSLRRKLVKKGYPVYIPKLAYQTGSFDDNARRLEQFILDNNLRDIYFIGQSSGGLIITQMGYKGRDRIKKFFAISTPFHGTLLALLFYFLPAGRQLLTGSSFLKKNEINFMTFPNLQCLYSRFDLVIIPGFQGRLGRNDDTEYPGFGHINLVMSPGGVNFILEKLELEDNKQKKQIATKKNSEIKSIPQKTVKKPVPGKNQPKKKPSAVKRAKKKI